MSLSGPSSLEPEGVVETSQWWRGEVLKEGLGFRRYVSTLLPRHRAIQAR